MAHQVPSVTASGMTFAEFQAAGVSGHLELLAAAQVAKANPGTAPTVAESGSAGTLVAATYYVCVSESDGFGETLAGPVSLGQAITGSESVVVTFHALVSGCISRNTYTSTSSTGPFTLYATGTTASTLTISLPPPTNSYAVAPPTTNTTGLSNSQLSLARAFKNGNFDNGVIRFWRTTIDAFNSGNPVPFNVQVRKLQDVAVVMALLNTMAGEQSALLDANPGTIGIQGSSETGIGQVYPGQDLAMIELELELQFARAQRDQVATHRDRLIKAVQTLKAERDGLASQRDALQTIVDRQGTRIAELIGIVTAERAAVSRG